MNGVDLKTGALLDQQLALSAYLEALLGETPEPVPVESAPSCPAVQLAPDPVMAPVVKEATPVAAPAPGPQAVVTPVARATGRPAWARTEFQCLLFQVAGLTLAVPLTALNGVLPLDLDAVTPMPGHSALFLGLIDHLGQQVRVVDTAQVVLPPERLAATGAATGRASHLVLIGEGRWGLAASGIGEVISLHPEDVKWRGSLGTRPWLAGTVIQHMCALLEVDAFLEQLGRGTPGNAMA